MYDILMESSLGQRLLFSFTLKFMDEASGNILWKNGCWIRDILPSTMSRYISRLSNPSPDLNSLYRFNCLIIPLWQFRGVPVYRNLSVCTSICMYRLGFSPLLFCFDNGLPYLVYHQESLWLSVCTSILMYRFVFFYLFFALTMAYHIWCITMSQCDAYIHVLIWCWYLTSK